MIHPAYPIIYWMFYNFVTFILFEASVTHADVQFFIYVALYNGAAVLCSFLLWHTLSLPNYVQLLLTLVTITIMQVHWRYVPDVAQNRRIFLILLIMPAVIGLLSYATIKNLENYAATVDHRKN